MTQPAQSGFEQTALKIYEASQYDKLRVAEMYRELEDALREFLRNAKSWETGEDQLWTWGGGIRVVNAAKDLAFYVLQTKQPPASTINLQDELRPITALQSQPPQLKDWFRARLPVLKTLLASQSWGDLSNAVVAGSFYVINASGKDFRGMDAVSRLVETAERMIRKSPIPRIRSVLYGDVLVTGGLRSSRTVAFYRDKDDSVWIRPQTQYGAASVRSLLHELGHRYWNRFAASNVPTAWVRHDSKLRLQARRGKVTYPAVGEPLPMPIKGHGDTPPRVTKIARDSRGLKFFIATGTFVRGSQIERFWKEKSGVDGFPSWYAYKSGNSEEHFCESLAMHVLGTLQEPHLSAFEEIVL